MVSDDELKGGQVRKRHRLAPLSTLSSLSPCDVVSVYVCVCVCV